MKKVVLAFLCLTLISGFLIIPAGTAKGTSWSDPVVTPLSGDSDFTIKLVDPISLSFGTTKTDQGLVVPSSFPAGEKQFAGKVVVIKGLENGKASLCYSFPTYRYGWRGYIYKWDGTVWQTLPTTLTEGIEGGAATVCTTISSDGTYAFIIGYSMRSKPSLLSECGEDFEATINMYYLPGESEPGLHAYTVYNIEVNQILPLGTRFSYSILNQNPSGSVSGALSLSGTVDGTIDTPGRQISFAFLLDDPHPPFWMLPPPWEWSEENRLYVNDVPGTFEEGWFTVRVTTPTCYKDFPYSTTLMDGIIPEFD